MGHGFSVKARGKAEADILIYEDVGESWFGGVSAKQFAADIKGLGAVETINVRLNSYGGDVFDGLAIYRQLVEHPARVVAHVDGIAASIASIIAMAGNEIRIAEAGFLMIHDAWGVAIGNAADMREVADRLETVTGSLTDVYVARTKQDRGAIRDWMQAETWFTAAEAVEHGFADSMVENMRAAARLDPARHKFRNPPAALAAPASPVRPAYEAAAAKIARLAAQRANQRIKESRGA